MSAPVVLPPKLDLSTAGDLADVLRGRAEEDLQIEASQLTNLGTPGLQVLLSAKKTLAAAGHDMTLVNASDAVLDQVSQFGLQPTDLGVTTEGGL